MKKVSSAQIWENSYEDFASPTHAEGAYIHKKRRCSIARTPTHTRKTRARARVRGETGTISFSASRLADRNYPAEGERLGAHRKATYIHIRTLTYIHTYAHTQCIYMRARALAFLLSEISRKKNSRASARLWRDSFIGLHRRREHLHPARSLLCDDGPLCPYIRIPPHYAMSMNTRFGNRAGIRICRFHDWEKPARAVPFLSDITLLIHNERLCAYKAVHCITYAHIGAFDREQYGV